jgi:alcohol dehydrogenase (cytochrome c)
VSIPSVLLSQSLDPKTLLKPPVDSWPTYNGDYSGRRYSPLTEINSSNIGGLTLAWFYRIGNIGPQRGVGNPAIKSTPLMVNGIRYFTIPDHAWAIDARTGEEIWHYGWQDQGGHLVGN